MRNKGFFWFLTIAIAVVCVYQISYTFVTNRVENEADVYAQEQLDSLRNTLSTNGESTVTLPNGRTVSIDGQESEDIILNFYTNAYLIDKGDKKVTWTGATYNESKNRSINLGLDLKGGMSVTLEVSIPDLVKSEAVNPRGSKFAKPYEEALETYQTHGGDFVDLFVSSYKKLNGDRKLVRDFYSSSSDELNKESTDDQVITFLKERVKGSLSGVENIMNRRINQFGVAQPNIQKDEQSNRIYIELPGVKDKNTVRQKLQSTANLEFFETYDNKSFTDFINRADEVLYAKYGKEESKDTETDLSLNLDGETTPVSDSTTLTLADNQQDSTKADGSADLSLNLGGDSSETAEPLKADSLSPAKTILGKYILAPASTNPNGHFDVLFYALSKDTATIGSLLREREVRELYPFLDVRFMWASNPTKFGENGEINGYALHAIRVPESGKAPVGGSDIDNARQGYDQLSRIAIHVTMTDKGTSKWAELTSRNLGKSVAIVMDGMVLSSPTVQAIMNDGNAQITGNYTVAEAKEFAALLNAGSLPAPCSIIDESIVGPTLGSENISSGMMSFVIALVIVLLYMIFYYGQAGVIANISLLANILFILGSLASFSAVLTLAGIAGIVLTIGMAVDANVLIYERIREEIAAGKGQKLAIKDGFAKALSSILDANLTTLLTAIILKIFGSGPIESFATTLIIGIFSSVFAAVVISRLIFENFNESKRNISFSTAITKNAFKNLNFSFVNKRKMYYAISGILVVVAIGALATRGLKFGVEFTGGRSFEVKFENAANPEDIASSLKSVMIAEDGKVADVIVKTKESKNQVEIQTNYLQGVINADTIVDAKLKAGLQKVEGEMGSFEVIQSRSVSAVISDELKQSSYLSITLSLIVIFLYILFRFGRWQYGLGALIAMTHDVIIVLGAFALFHGLMPFNMDIDQAFIAAILTVVGYSINDTVVVFDRIREVLGLHKRKGMEENINDALNSTLSRTINTSMSTFVVLLTIFILGGDAIRGFIFALMIGVIVGTYSSVCIATPVIVDLMKNKKGEEK